MPLPLSEGISFGQIRYRLLRDETFGCIYAYYIVMTYNKQNNHIKRGGIVKIFLTILLLLSVSVTQILPDRNEYEGLMPAVEVIAQRYSEDVSAYVGSMSEVTVTALRYEHEDEAWSGLMPEVVVTAVRPSLEAYAYFGINDSSIDVNIIPSALVR